VKECKTVLENKCDQLPELLTQTLRNKFEIEGATAVTQADLERMSDGLYQKLESKFMQATALITATNTSKVAGIDSNESKTEHSRFLQFHWGGKFRNVPEDWRVPTNNAKDVWILWHFGHASNRIRPYCQLEQNDTINGSQSVQLSRVRTVMKRVEAIARELNLIQADKGTGVQDLSLIEANELFDKAYTALMEQLEVGSKRWGEMSLATVSNLIKEHKKKLVSSILNATVMPAPEEKNSTA